MRHILTNQSDGTRYYPMINQNTQGGGNYLKEAPSFYIENLSSEECVVTLKKTGSPNPITLCYSVDKQFTWTTLSMADVTSGSFSIPANGKAYLKGNNSTFSTSQTKYYSFSFDKHCNIGGKLMSLIGDHNIATDMFCCLFFKNTNLVSAKNLVLPNNVADGCYGCMFYRCSSLVNAPALPATTMAYRCYGSMFNDCTSLVSAPALPATTLCNWCYNDMFDGCTSLVNAPALPAVYLYDHCYYSMFKNCTSLINVSALPATTLTNNCYESMFSGCTSLVNAPALPATTMAYGCYNSMFNDCTSLVNAPELLATTLNQNCYNYMFYGCTKLNYIKAMFTTTPSSTYTNNWLSGVVSSGTFVKNASATWDVTGANGIPEGWIVETAVA